MRLLHRISLRKFSIFDLISTDAGESSSPYFLSPISLVEKLLAPVLVDMFAARSASRRLASLDY